MADPVGIVVVHPELLGTYGDGGNAIVLAQRLRWRGIDAELVEVRAGEPVPETAQLYCIGGGEDGPQTRSADELMASGALQRAVEAGAAVLAVCAGFQIVGSSFPGLDGRPRPGVGLIDVSTRRGEGPRAVGEVVSDAGFGLPAMTGYENHASVTSLGPGVQPLGRVRVGAGNGGDSARLEGAVMGRVLCTYLHGPVLARNPAVADRLLAWALGEESLDPIDDSEVERLRRERLAAAARESEIRRRRRWSPGWTFRRGGPPRSSDAAGPAR